MSNDISVFDVRSSLSLLLACTSLRVLAPSTITHRPVFAYNWSLACLFGCTLASAPQQFEASTSGLALRFGLLWCSCKCGTEQLLREQLGTPGTTLLTCNDFSKRQTTAQHSTALCMLCQSAILFIQLQGWICCLASFRGFKLVFTRCALLHRSLEFKLHPGNA